MNSDKLNKKEDQTSYDQQSEKQEEIEPRVIIDQHPVLLNIVLHLLPGVLAGLVFWLLAFIFDRNNLPTIFALYVAIAVIIIPFELGLLLFLGYKKNQKLSLRNVIYYTKKIPIWQLIGFSILAFAWAAFIFAYVDKWLSISTSIQETLFSWLPEYYNFSDIYLHPENYSLGILIGVWIIGLFLVSTIAPIIEELYFRGYLMPKISRFKYLVPLINTVLFAVYHFWSPWLIPIRIIAILPMIYFVWWKQDIKIGIITHILLNLIGDSIMTIPLFFG